MVSLQAGQRPNTCGDESKADAPLVAELVTTRAELDRLAGDWNELLRDSKANTVFLTWEWISTWLDTVYPDAPLFVVAVRDSEDRLMAIAPFYLSDLSLSGLLKYKCLRIFGDCQSGAEYGDIIVRGGFEDAAMNCLVQELLTHSSVWDCIWIPNMAGWTGVHERFSKVCTEFGLYMHKRSREFSMVTLPGAHEAYLKQLSRNRREQIRRKTRQAEKSHDVESICCDHRDELPRVLSDLFVLHRRRWESVGQAGSFVRRPLMQRFYESFAPIALQRGWLHLHALKVDGVVRAIQYGYAYDGVFSQLQEGYDPDVFDGVGNVLRNHVIRTCIENGVREYDFLGGFTEHKRRWGAEVREGLDLLIGRRSLRNRLLFWRDIWPTGRFLQQGRPANEGRSHA